MVSPIGLWDGRWARRSGAAGCTERAAQGRVLVALLPPPSLLLPTIATQASPTGWLGGVHQRRIGAARMLARAAQQQLEVVLESPVSLSERCTRGRWRLRHLPAILSTCNSSQSGSPFGHMD